VCNAVTNTTFNSGVNTIGAIDGSKRSIIKYATPYLIRRLPNALSHQSLQPFGKFQSLFRRQFNDRLKIIGDQPRLEQCFIGQGASQTVAGVFSVMRLKIIGENLFIVR
jgi:hypothetical protein